MSEPQSMERAGGISFDFSVNIPSLVLIITTLVSVTAGWVHTSDKATQLAADLENQTYAVQRVSGKVERISTTLTVLDERLKVYPLHRHVSPTITIYDNTPAADMPADVEGADKRHGAQ